MRLNPCWLLGLLSPGLLVGCVERRFVITSQPMGALVYHNGKPIGTTPCDQPFLYYGIHEFTFVKDGFETRAQHYEVSMPWYQVPGVDVVTELFIPYTFQDVQHIHTDLQPAARSVPNLVPRALELRDRVKAIPGAEPPPPVQPLPPQPLPPGPFPGQVLPPGGPPAPPILLPPEGGQPGVFPPPGP